MMKLVVSFCEFQKPFGQFDPSLDRASQYMEAITDMLYDFLEDQFPMWDMDLTFKVDKAEWDFENNEVHIPFIMETNTFNHKD